MLTSFEEWRNSNPEHLEELADMPQPTPPPVQHGASINNRKIGQAFGGGTAVANPKMMSYLKPRIDGLWRLNVYKAEKENPGSTADPGRMRQLQDQFIKDLVVVVTKAVRGDDSGGGRAVNFNRGAMNQPLGNSQQVLPPNVAAQTAGQNPQIN